MQPGAQSDPFKQFKRPVLHGIARIGNERGNKNVFQNGALREQMVILENEADLFIAEGRQVLVVQFMGIPALQAHRAGGRSFHGAQDVQQRCFCRCPRDL